MKKLRSGEVAFVTKPGYYEKEIREFIDKHCIKVVDHSFFWHVVILAVGKGQEKSIVMELISLNFIEFAGEQYDV